MVLGWSQDGGGEESGLCGWLSRVRGSVRRWQKGSQPPWEGKEDEGAEPRRVYFQPVPMQLGFIRDFLRWGAALCSRQLWATSSSLTAAAAVVHEGLHIHGFDRLQI